LLLDDCFVVDVYFVIDSVRKLLDILSYMWRYTLLLCHYVTQYTHYTRSGVSLRIFSKCIRCDFFYIFDLCIHLSHTQSHSCEADYTTQVSQYRQNVLCLLSVKHASRREMWNLLSSCFKAHTNSLCDKLWTSRQ